MSEELMPGDRVRITPRCRRRDYKAGDKGTVLEGPADRAGAGEQSYVVAMDKDGPSSTSVVFGADDIESDD
jgi:hypothetical protein